MPVALIVVDMQVQFETLAKPIANKLQTVIQECRYQKVPIFFTQHGHKELTTSAALVRKWGKEGSIQYGSPAWQLLPVIKDAKTDEDTVIEKDRYDAFHGTQLESTLRQQGITAVAIAGVLTNLCCESTARGAFSRDFDVLFLKDATATSSPEMQRATETNIEFGFGKVLSTQEFLSQMEELAKTPSTES